MSRYIFGVKFFVRAPNGRQIAECVVTHPKLSKYQAMLRYRMIEEATTFSDNAFSVSDSSADQVTDK